MASEPPISPKPMIAIFALAREKPSSSAMADPYQ
jgi:hypothetical protein